MSQTFTTICTDDMAEQGKLLTTVASLLDDGTLVSMRQEALHGLTPENIQAMWEAFQEHCSY